MNTLRAWALPALAAGGVISWLAYRVCGRPAALAGSESLTGAVLLGLLALLSLFNMKKRLAMLPLGSSAAWLRWHAALGGLAAGIFWLHARSLWPLGLYERVLTALFWAVTASGVLGLLLQRLYPPLLATRGVEVIYERIPEDLWRLRALAEQTVLSCTAETGSDTLARHYADNLAWFFRRPRFCASHAVVGTRGQKWVRHQLATVRRYLTEPEARFQDRLLRLAFHKNDLDFHYAAQGIMKGWLLVHVPLAAALLLMALWHLLVVLVYWA